MRVYKKEGGGAFGGDGDGEGGWLLMCECVFVVCFISLCVCVYKREGGGWEGCGVRVLEREGRWRACTMLWVGSPGLRCLPLGLGGRESAKGRE